MDKYYANSLVITVDETIQTEDQKQKKEQLKNLITSKTIWNEAKGTNAVSIGFMVNLFLHQMTSSLLCKLIMWRIDFVSLKLNNLKILARILTFYKKWQKN